MEVSAKVIDPQEAQPREADFRQRIEDKFQLAFAQVYQSRNQEGDVPTVSVEMFFSPHATPEDLSGLRRKIRRDSLDVYIPEAFGWKQKDLELFRQSSFGEITPEELDKRLRKYPPPFSTSIKDIYYFHMPAMIIDVPAGHRLKKESDEAWEYKPPLEGNFSEALNYTRTFLNSLATRQNERENYMLLQIAPQKIEELLNMYPRLKNQQSIRILISLGLCHAPLPYDYPESSLIDQGIMMSRFGKEVDDDLAAKIFLETFMEQLFSTAFASVRDRLTSDSRKLSMFKRKILSQFGYEDAKRIFNYCKRKRIFPRDEFNRMFKEKNIILPTSTKELDEFLAKSLFLRSNSPEPKS